MTVKMAMPLFENNSTNPIAKANEVIVTEDQLQLSFCDSGTNGMNLVILFSTVISVSIIVLVLE